MLFHEYEFSNRFHALGEPFYSHQSPSPLNAPELVPINASAAGLLDHNAKTLNNDFFGDVACGNQILKQSQPFAAIYAGLPPDWANEISVSCSS